jgi:hypothetical protein
VRNILKALGKIGKGGASIVGAVLGVGGIGAAVAGGDEQIAACISTVLSQPAGTVTLVGVALLVFGIGRKAGFVVGKEAPK